MRLIYWFITIWRIYCVVSRLRKLSSVSRTVVIRRALRFYAQKIAERPEVTDGRIASELMQMARYLGATPRESLEK